jgi:hypothetical protein
MRLRLTSGNPTCFSDEKWETLSIDSTRGTGAGICKKKKEFSLWLLGLAAVVTACHYNDNTYMYFTWEQFSLLHTQRQLLMMKMCKYLLSAAVIRNGV